MKQFSGYIIIAAAVVIASLLYACTHRYTPFGSRLLDHWTGKIVPANE